MQQLVVNVDEDPVNIPGSCVPEDQRGTRAKAVYASYMARGILHPIFGCPCMHLLSQLPLNFHKRRY